MDVSRQQGSGDFSAARDYVETFVSRLHIDEDLIKVALYTFDEDASKVIDFEDSESSQLSDVLSKVSKLKRGQSSDLNIANALKTMREVTFTSGRGDRADAANIGILFIGGVANEDADLIATEGGECRQEGIDLVGIGYDEASIEQIELFASVKFDVHQSYHFASKSEVEAFEHLEEVVDFACVEPAWTGNESKCHHTYYLQTKFRINESVCFVFRELLLSFLQICWRDVFLSYWWRDDACKWNGMCR